MPIAFEVRDTRSGIVATHPSLTARKMAAADDGRYVILNPDSLELAEMAGRRRKLARNLARDRAMLRR